MKRLFTCLFAMLLTLVVNAKVDIDYSSRFEEGTNTINCTSAWGWHSVNLGSSFEIEEAEYLYISYESSCNFNLILQNENWQNAYSVVCRMDETEGYIKLTPGAVPYFSCVVIQNHAEGEITINKIYFCSEDEFYNPAPDDLEGARANLIEIYLRYQKYLDQFEVGEDYGQYPADLYQTFSDAVNAALIMDNEEEMEKLTVEQLNAMSQAIVDAYKALVAAKKMYLPSNGYYRFICARQFVEGSDEEGWTNVTKAMYSDNTGANNWKTVDREDATFLWTLEQQEDKTYILRNASNKLIFNSAEKCGDKENFISIDAISKVDGAYNTIWPLSTDEDIIMFNFRFSDQPANDYKYIHMNWHSSGTGWGGPITVWCNTTEDSGASEWYLEPVDESVAQELLNSNYSFAFAQMLTDAKEKAAIADDMTREKLITDAEQFSSPFSQNDLGQRDGGNLAEGVLLDGSNSTFWHSYWSGGNAEAGLHYLQVEMAEEIGGEIEFDFSRRKGASDDHVTMWGIYGSNDFDGEKYDYEWITDLETPYGSNDESIVTRFTIEDGKKYQYLRFYAEKTSSNRGYWHVSEFQLYALSENPNNQAQNMGETYTNLLNAIAKAETVDQSAVSKADYDALKAAYDAFMEKFVDPSELRMALESAETAIDLCTIGDNPGEWTQEVYDGFIQQIEEVKTYDQSGKYTQEQTDAFIALLGDGKNAFLATANKVSPDKFYTIRFASEDLYDERGWSTSNVLSEDWGDLFDTYLCPADAETLESTPADELRQGSFMFFTNDDKADIAFRFIPVGDKFIIQHQASGLFIQCYGRNSWTGLTLTPSLFTVEAVGYGENIIRGVDYEDKDLACLHAQLNNHRLVTWQDDYAGCNSGLIIEEIGADAVGKPLADYKAGEVTTMCYPVSVQPSEGSLFSVVGTYSADDKVYVAMNKVEKAEAGQPVVYIAKGTYDEEKEDDVNTITLTIGTSVVTTPQNDGALQGTYNDIDLESEAIIFRGDKCEMSTEETARVYGNHAYVVPDGKADASGSYSLVLEVGATADGISKAFSDVTRQGDVFDMSGRLVRSKATLNDVHSLPHGIYILNGIKVLVK